MISVRLVSALLACGFFAAGARDLKLIANDDDETEGPAGLGGHPADDLSFPGPGPSDAVKACQENVWKEYQGLVETADPMFNPLLSLEDQMASFAGLPVSDAFDGVQLVKIPEGEAFTTAWECSVDTGCLDSEYNLLTSRGYALLWAPVDLERGAPRAVYLHGGGWSFGSPSLDGYAPFAAALAKTLDMAVLVIDYTLIPVADFSTILEQVGDAANWLSSHDPLDALTGDFETETADRPPLYVLGDSAGGGTAVSALIAQATPLGLPGAGDAVFSGGVVFSPWLDLVSNAPSYWSQEFANTTGGVLVGDIAFPSKSTPRRMSSADRLMALAYVGGDASKLTSPLTNPMYASPEVLALMPPLAIHTGMPEKLSADSAIFATHMSQAGGSVRVHLYDSMWHDFPMYPYRLVCEAVPGPLPASSLAASAVFLNEITTGTFPGPPEAGAPNLVNHYEYPLGYDSAAYAEWGVAIGSQ